MAGYEVPDLRVFRLHFDNRPGLEVLARSATLADWMAITGQSGDDALSATSLPDGGPPPSPGLQGAFAERLVSWNLTKGGEPVPANADALPGLDVDLVRDLVKGWLEAVSGVIPPDLGKDSGSGGTSPEESLALAASSSSLPNSDAPG